MDITGFVKMVGQTQEVSSSFKKREIVVTTEEQYPQHILIEFTQDKCDLLNNVMIGEPVKIGINLRGREWTNPQGETRYFNSIQGWKIESQKPQQQQGYTNTGYYGQGSAVDAYNQQNGYQQAPQQVPQQGYGQPQQNFNPNQNYGGNQNFNQQQQGYGQQQNFNPNFQQAQGNQNNEEPDDLPF